MNPRRLTDDQRADYEDRAAIMEFDGGLSREDAERAAGEIVMGEEDQR